MLFLFDFIICVSYVLLVERLMPEDTSKRKRWNDLSLKAGSGRESLRWKEMLKRMASTKHNCPHKHADLRPHALISFTFISYEATQTCVKTHVANSLKSLFKKRIEIKRLASGEPKSSLHLSPERAQHGRNDSGRDF